MGLSGLNGDEVGFGLYCGTNQVCQIGLRTMKRSLFSVGRGALVRFAVWNQLHDHENPATCAWLCASSCRRPFCTGWRDRLLSYTPSTITGMPQINAPRPCWHCTSWSGLVYAGVHGTCNLTGSRRVNAMPATGCAFWVRETGTDDEPGPPQGFTGSMSMGPLQMPQQAPAAPASQLVEWVP